MNLPNYEIRIQVTNSDGKCQVAAISLVYECTVVINEEVFLMKYKYCIFYLNS